MPRRSPPLEVGTRFGRLTVTGHAERSPSGRRRAHVLCDCGAARVVQEGNLKQGITQSCGCLQRERFLVTVTKHGHRRDTHTTPEYLAWASMLSRCYQESDTSYPYNGAKGIVVCKRWRESFVKFFEDVGARPSPDHVLARTNPKRNYTPKNTCWVHRSEHRRSSSRNRTFTINGVTKCLVDWAEEYDIPKSTLHYRLRKGMTIEEALNTAPHSGKLLAER